VLSTAAHLEREGASVTRLRTGASGIVNPDDVRRALRPETALVSVMHANNELGTIQPIVEIARITREAGVLFHVDGVQALGKIPVDVEALGVDLYSMSGHKLYAPKGVGALYVRKGTRLSPISFGGHHERDRRAGTESVPLIVGLGKTAELARLHLAERAEHMRELRDYLESELLGRISGISRNGDLERRVPSIANFNFEHVEGEGLQISLDLKGVAVSTGSACASGSTEPSHVLVAIGLSRDSGHGSLRFSLSKDTTKDEIDYLLDTLPPVVERLRCISPLAKKKEVGEGGLVGGGG
jgi:cysteine desulfurase